MKKLELFLYGVVGEEDNTLRAWTKAIAAARPDAITLHVNSPGGDAVEGMAMFTMLARHKAKVATTIDGLAASAGGLIAMAGDTVAMVNTGLFMIHPPHALAFGAASVHRNVADVLDKIAGDLVDAYTMRAGEEQREALAAMVTEGETYLAADQAAEMGLVDEVLTASPMAVAACANTTWQAVADTYAARVADAGHKFAAARKRPLTVPKANWTLDHLDNVLAHLA